MKLLIITATPHNPPPRAQMLRQSFVKAGWDVEVRGPDIPKIPTPPPLMFYDEAAEITEAMFGETQ